MTEELALERKTAICASRKSIVHKEYSKESISFYDGVDEIIKIETVKLESPDEGCLNTKRLMFDHILSRPDLAIVSTDGPCIFRDQIEIGEVKIEAFDSTDYPALAKKCPPTSRQEQFKPSSTVKQGASTKSCEKSRDPFSNRELLRNHFKIHYRCEACNKSYDKQIFLDYHNATKHGFIEQSRTYITHKQCPECGKFIVTRNFKRHVKMHKPYAPFRCAICNKSFKRLDYLDGHYFAYHPTMEYERTHLGRQCPDCGKIFSSKHYKRHLLVHVQDAPFWCEICKKSYRLKTSLKQHITAKHRSSEDIQIS